jgi:MFS family permease
MENGSNMQIEQDRGRSMFPIRIVGGAAVGLAAGLPPLFLATSGVFMQSLLSEFHWGRAETSLSYASSMMGLALASPVVGILVDRFGARRTTFISAILFGLCVAAMSLQRGSTTSWVALSFVIGVFGAATSGPGYLSILPQTFDRRLGLALGLSMIGLGVGTTVMPLLAQHLIAAFGWRSAYILLGTCSIPFATAARLLLGGRGVDEVKKSTRQANTDAHGNTLAEALASWRLWTIFGAFFAASMGTHWLFPHVPMMMTDKGFSAAEAASTTSLIGTGLITGRFVTGVLLDRIHAPFLASGFFLTCAAGLVLLETSTTYPLLLTAGFTLGLTIGAEGDLINYLVKSYFGLRAFGTLYGIAFAGYALGGVIGPVVAGKLFDVEHSYASALTLSPCGLLAAAIMLPILGRYRFKTSIDCSRMKPARR